VDKYRLFSIERLQDGNFLAFGACYMAEEDYSSDDPLGKTIMFFLGNKFDDTTTLADLK
jgi:hypothetical protein